jgi:hypothetical protein
MASITTAPKTTASATTNSQIYRGPFAIMTVLFFMWGLMTVFNDILCGLSRNDNFWARTARWSFLYWLLAGSLRSNGLDAVRTAPRELRSFQIQLTLRAKTTVLVSLRMGWEVSWVLTTPVNGTSKKVRVPDLALMKERGERIVMLTAYVSVNSPEGLR